MKARAKKNTFASRSSCHHSQIQGFLSGDGGGGSRPDGQKNSLDNVFILVLNLFYSLQSGSSGFITEKTLLFQDLEGVYHFPGGGVQLFPGGKCI